MPVDMWRAVQQLQVENVAFQAARTTLFSLQWTSPISYHCVGRVRGGGMVSVSLFQEDWEESGRLWRILLEIEVETLWPDHPCVVGSLGVLALCSTGMGIPKEKNDWIEKSK